MDAEHAMFRALNQLWVEPEDPLDHPDWRALPGKLLDGLKAAGFAVVKLPEPDSTRYEGDEHESADRLCWMPGDDFEVSVWDSGEVQRHGYGWGHDEPLSVAEARTVAAALLAAAVAAEKAGQ